MTTGTQCCCRWGAAVGGGDEWPEFECAHCEHHRDGFQMADRLCKRHRREQLAALVAEHEREHGVIVQEEIASLPWID